MRMPNMRSPVRAAEAINQASTKADGSPGTTRSPRWNPLPARKGVFAGETRLSATVYAYVVDLLMTNFRLPKSTPSRWQACRAGRSKPMPMRRRIIALPWRCVLLEEALHER